MRILSALAIFILVTPAARAQSVVIDCRDYSGVPFPVSSLPPDHSVSSPVAVADGFCTIESYRNLRFWPVSPTGVPEVGGLLEPTHGHLFTQLAVHDHRIYGANGEMGIVIHEIQDSTWCIGTVATKPGERLPQEFTSSVSSRAYERRHGTSHL